MQSGLMRPKKTNIVRKRTGCQRCRNRRRKCDETQPECIACVRSGVRCSGYQNRIRFKDVSNQAAEASKKAETARRTALELEDADRNLRLSRQSDREGSALINTQDSAYRGSMPAESISGQAADQVADIDLEFIFDPYFGATDESDTCGYAPTFNPPLGSLLWSRIATNDAVTPNMLCDGGPATPRSWLPEVSKADNQELFASADGPQAQGSSSPWESLTGPLETSRVFTPQRQIADTSIGSNQGQCCGLMSEQALLSIFQADIAQNIPLDLEYSALFDISSGFRAAALALTLSTCRCVGRTSEAPATDGCEVLCEHPCHYYDFAVADLAHQASTAKQDAIDAIVGTAVLLIYRDLVVGSHRDVCRHLRQLEVVSSTVDLPAYCKPTLLRAWRMLSFEMRIRALPTRKSIAGPLPPLLTNPQWDSRVTIRDIFTSLWKLHARVVVEAPFQDDQMQSASEKAARWLCSVLGRRCDRGQLSQQDYHDQSLSWSAITDQCAVFEERLNAWHRAIPHADLPVPSLSASADELLCGSSFGAIVPYHSVDRNKGNDYLLYLISRLICLYLKSSYQRRDNNAYTPVFASEAVGRIALGVALGLGPETAPGFNEPSVISAAYLIVLLSDGTSMGNAVLEGLFPNFKKNARDVTPAQHREIAYIERMIQIVVQERYSGRSIRLMISGTDEDERYARPANRFAVFGDFSGRGCFRDVCQRDETI